ncbi:hypothetical protein TNIN_439671 [Trichonephila inaurata madagascariensis]|uniref:Uncharacterized protein n=1 Tax=Trichonephila inaurata madagascariensis TaxID=2747483 RepID=A0A8X6XA84_9ARAC|nr:hypothetical protein TNIN_439671 [Trichonephila inaurata madagascariensis]
MSFKFQCTSSLQQEINIRQGEQFVGRNDSSLHKTPFLNINNLICNRYNLVRPLPTSSPKSRPVVKFAVDTLKARLRKLRSVSHEWEESTPPHCDVIGREGGTISSGNGETDSTDIRI